MPLLAPLMIKTTATASTIVAPKTSPRRTQYVQAASGPTGRSMPLMQPSLGSMALPRPEARRPGPRIAPRRAEPGWRAAVLDEGASRHVFRLRATEEGCG